MSERGPARRTLRVRIIALAGIGVFATGVVVSLLSRQSLLALDAVVQAERTRVADVAAAALARDLVADLETLESAAAAPRGQPLASWVRGLRLADGLCRAGPSETTECFPAQLHDRIRLPELDATIRNAELGARPAVSPFIRQPDGSFDAVAVVPGEPGGVVMETVVAVIAAGSAHMQARTPPQASLTDELTRAGDGLSVVPGTPWTMRVSPPPGTDDPVAAFRRRSLWFAPSMAVLAMVMAWGIVQSVQRPVLAMSRAAEQIAAGDLSVPIAGGDDEIGRLGAALDDMRGHLKVSIEANARASAELERRVEERTVQLQRLLRKVISAQEDERRRIARELHDETSQVLAALGMALHVGPAVAAAEELQPLVTRLQDGVHRLIVNLRPPVLDDLGLAAAIGGLAESQLARSGIAVRCELGELRDARLDSAIEIAVFRIAQEAMLNILRHSGATAVLLQGGVTDGRLWIELEDDGVGFDPAAVAPRDGSLRGIGLLGMHERAELIDAQLTIDSAPGEGTRVRLEVNVTQEEAVPS